jgi:LysR family glycine cleavage system transcriptional activator
MTYRLPPFKSIEAFVVAAQSLSFTTAASVLRITVPAVSRRIQALEMELGVVLFHRMHRSLRLTSAGQSYVDKLAPVIDTLRQASESVRGMPRANRVKVSVLPSFAANWLFPRLSRFQSTHRNVQIVFDTSTEYVDFDRSDVDLAIRLGRGNWPGLHVRPLLDIMAFPVCCPALIARGHSLRSPHDLLKYPLMSTSHQTELWRDLLRMAGVVEPPTVQFTNFETFNLLYEAAAAGLGIATGLDALVEPYIEDGRLVRPLQDLQSRLPKRFYLVCRNHDRDRLPVRTLCSWLMDEAAAWRNQNSLATDVTERSQSSIVLEPLSE